MEVNDFEILLLNISKSCMVFIVLIKIKNEYNRDRWLKG